MLRWRSWVKIKEEVTITELYKRPNICHFDNMLRFDRLRYARPVHHSASWTNRCQNLEVAGRQTCESEIRLSSGNVTVDLRGPFGLAIVAGSLRATAGWPFILNIHPCLSRRKKLHSYMRHMTATLHKAEGLLPCIVHMAMVLLWLLKNSSHFSFLFFSIKQLCNHILDTYKNQVINWCKKTEV